MTPPYYRRTTCRLCEGTALETVLDFPETPSGDAYIPAEKLAMPQQTYPLALLFCKECGLLQLPDVVAPEILYGNYIYFTGISLGLTEHFQTYADAVLDLVKPSSGSLVVDVGSNDGTLLKCFMNRGMHVLGVDPAQEVAKRASAAGIETITTYFAPAVAKEIKAKHGAATIVTANNVLANIDNIPDVVDAIRELLAPEGVFVFETGYMPDLIQKIILDNVYHEHISYYSVTPLNKFFENHGMQLVDIRHVPTKGGSIRGVVQLTGGPRQSSSGVVDMLRLEQILGYTEMTPFKAFAERTNRIRSQLFETVKAIKAEGKSIAGYGASVGMTTLIYFFGLAQYLDYLVDDNATRHNLFSPGHHLQVFSSETLYERKPDYVVLLAWQYAEPIIKRHQSYIGAGGRFMVPIPELRIV